MRFCNYFSAIPHFDGEIGKNIDESNHPYFNVDPGTMSPYQHGEVFVTDDGAETDLDLGHYERFVDEALDGNASVSSGKVFWAVLNRERQGGYLGGTVQIIPHITDEIKRRVYAMDNGETDVVITEIGGTVGASRFWRLSGRWRRKRDGTMCCISTCR